MTDNQQTQNEQQEEECSEYSEQQQKEKQRDQKDKLRLHKMPKKLNLNQIVMNVSQTHYPVVSEVGEQLKWKLQTSIQARNWDVYWTDSAILPDILFRMHSFQKINHYPGIHVIARKNLLGINLMAMRQKFKDQYNFFPLTWMLPSQYSQFRHYFESVKKGKKRTYIVKPEADCQGRGIFLTRSIEQLVNGNHYVVQRYLTKPFLIDGLKFDFRIYVLLAGIDPLRIYIYEEGLARFATQPYQEPASDNMDNMCMHLTNYAINKLNPKFIFNKSSNDMGIGHKRSLTSVYKLLEKRGYDIQKLKQKVNDIVIKTFITGLPLISHQYKFCQPQDFTGNMCFHILGFDIMLNRDLDPYLLEVNHTPSFATDTPLDKFIKRKLIKDTLILMNINQERKKQLFRKYKQDQEYKYIHSKKRIISGIEKAQSLLNAQIQRDQYEKNLMGGYTKIHPTDNQEIQQKYLRLIEYSNKIYNQQNNVRNRLFTEQKNNMKQHEKKMKASMSVKKNQFTYSNQQMNLKIQSSIQIQILNNSGTLPLNLIALPSVEIAKGSSTQKILRRQKQSKIEINERKIKIKSEMQPIQSSKNVIFNQLQKQENMFNFIKAPNNKLSIQRIKVQSKSPVKSKKVRIQQLSPLKLEKKYSEIQNKKYIFDVRIVNKSLSNNSQLMLRKDLQEQSQKKLNELQKRNKMIKDQQKIVNVLGSKLVSNQKMIKDLRQKVKEPARNKQIKRLANLFAGQLERY